MPNRDDIDAEIQAPEYVCNRSGGVIGPQHELIRLHEILAKRFDVEELRTFCFRLGIDYDDLKGEGKPGKARELVTFLERHGRIGELVATGKQLRPDVAWDSDGRDPSAPNQPAKPPTTVVVVILQGDVEKFISTERDDFIMLLSRILKQPPDQIAILGIERGSVKVTLKMPEEAAKLLALLYEKRAAALQELQILDIKLLNTVASSDETEQIGSGDHLHPQQQSPKYGRSTPMSQHFPDRSIADWLVSLRKRDPQTCTDLYRICLFVAKRHFRNWDEVDPEDVASEAWIKIISLVNDRPIRSSFEGFAVAVVNRHCFDVKRGIKRDRELVDGPVDEETESSLPSDIDSTAVSDPTKVALYTALDQCITERDDEERQIVYWYAEGKGPKWISQQLGPSTTPNKVSVDWYRIRKRIKRCMEALGQNPIRRS